MAYRSVQIHRLHRITAGQVDDVVALRQLDQVAEILLVARAPAVVHVRAIGRAGDLGKRQIFAANVYIAFRVARVQRELGRAGFDGLQNQIAVKTHPFRAGFDISPGFFQDGTCTFVHEIHAHFFQNLQRGGVDRLQLVLRDHGRGRQAVLQMAVFGGRGRGAHGATATSGASAGRCGRCFFCHGGGLQSCANSMQFTLKKPFSAALIPFWQAVLAIL